MQEAGGNFGLSSALAALPATPRLMFIGDSNTLGVDFGTYNGMQGGYPVPAVQTLRGLRGDFEVIGSVISYPENCVGSSVPYQEGHGGATIATLTAGYAGYVATVGVGAPDVAISCVGAADIVAGRTLLQMQTDTAAYLAAILAQSASTIVVFMSPCPFAAGTTVGANLAAWNAIQAAYATWLQNTFVPANSTRTTFCAATLSVGQGDYFSDGVHLNQGGQGAVGQSVGQFLDRLMSARRGAPKLPRVFRQRQPWAAYQLPNGAADFATCTNHPGFNPGAGSFTVAFDFCPTDLGGGGSNLTLLSYGSGGTNNYWAILRVNNQLLVYWQSVGAYAIPGTDNTVAISPGLTLNAWHRIVLMVDATTGTIGLYVNGQLAGINTGLAAWTSTLQTTYIGAGANYNGAAGYYGRIFAAPAIPGRPGSVAALEAVEADYYLGSSLTPGLGSAVFPLDAILTDDVYAPGAPNPSFVLHGAAASVAAYPLGCPPRPWEYQLSSAPAQLVGFAAFASLVTAAAQALPHGSGATSSTSDLVLGILMTRAGSFSSLIVQHTGAAGNVAGQTISYAVYKNGVAAGTAIAGVAATAGVKVGAAYFAPVFFVPGDVLSVQLLPSALLTTALVDVMASVG